MRITSKGQVTIPQELRLRAGLMPNMEVEFSYEDGKIILRKAERQPSRGDLAVERLRGATPRTSPSAPTKSWLVRAANESAGSDRFERPAGYHQE